MKVLTQTQKESNIIYGDRETGAGAAGTRRTKRRQPSRVNGGTEEEVEYIERGFE